MTVLQLQTKKEKHTSSYIRVPTFGRVYCSRKARRDVPRLVPASMPAGAHAEQLLANRRGCGIAARSLVSRRCTCMYVYNDMCTCRKNICIYILYVKHVSIFIVFFRYTLGCGSAIFLPQSPHDPPQQDFLALRSTVGKNNYQNHVEVFEVFDSHLRSTGP